MNSLCNYSDLFGKPGEGIRKYRIFNISIIDVVLTMILAHILRSVFKISLITSLVLCFIAGIIVHQLFCVKTTINKLLF